MRRLAPLLPLAFALATLMGCMLRAIVWQGQPEWVDRAIGWGWMYVCFGAYLVPYAVPMLLLALSRHVRRRSAAPPSTDRVAVALALPALAVAMYWLVDLAGLYAFAPDTSLILALSVDHQVACIATWATSTAATGLWVLATASRWIWWPRPAAVMGTPPYRLAARTPTPGPRLHAFRAKLRGMRSAVAICLAVAGLVAVFYSLSEPPPAPRAANRPPDAPHPPGWKGGSNSGWQADHPVAVNRGVNEVPY